MVVIRKIPTMQTISAPLDRRMVLFGWTKEQCDAEDAAKRKQDEAAFIVDRVGRDSKLIFFSMRDLDQERNASALSEEYVERERMLEVMDGDT